MMRKLMMLAALCGMAILPAMGQEKKAAKSYVLKAARMFDGKSNALATPGLVVVSDGKIVAVGAGARYRRERK